MKINLRARFTNPNFVFRFIAAIFVPALAGIGMEWQELTSWGTVGSALLAIISNPVVVALTLYNAFNILSDGTTEGFSDSELALGRQRAGQNAKRAKTSAK